MVPGYHLNSRLSKAKLARHQKVLELKAIDTEIRVITKLLKHDGPRVRSKIKNYDQKLRTESRKKMSRHTHLRAATLTRGSSPHSGSRPSFDRATAAFPSAQKTDEPPGIETITPPENQSQHELNPCTPLQPMKFAQSKHEVLPQYSGESSFDRLMRFISGYAMRPLEVMDLIPCIEEEQRAARLSAAVPGRAVEGGQRDPKIRFKSRLFQRRIPVNTRRFIDSAKVSEVEDKLIASLFRKSGSRLLTDTNLLF